MRFADSRVLRLFGQSFVTRSHDTSVVDRSLSAQIYTKETITFRAGNFLACENIRFSSLFAAGDVSRGNVPIDEERKGKKGCYEN